MSTVKHKPWLYVNGKKFRLEPAKTLPEGDMDGYCVQCDARKISGICSIQNDLCFSGEFYKDSNGGVWKVVK